MESKTPNSRKREAIGSQSPAYTGRSPKCEAMLARKRKQDAISGGTGRSKSPVVRCLSPESQDEHDNILALQDACDRIQRSLNQEEPKKEFSNNIDDRSKPPGNSSMEPRSHDHHKIYNNVPVLPDAIAQQSANQEMLNISNIVSPQIMAYIKAQNKQWYLSALNRAISAHADDRSNTFAPFNNLQFTLNHFDLSAASEERFEPMAHLLTAYNQVDTEETKNPRNLSGSGTNYRLPRDEGANRFWAAIIKFLQDCSKCEMTRRIVIDEATEGLTDPRDKFFKKGTYQDVIKANNESWEKVFENSPKEMANAIAKFFISSPKAIKAQVMVDLAKTKNIGTVPSAEQATFIGECAVLMGEFQEVIGMTAKAPLVSTLQKLMSRLYPKDNALDSRETAE